MSACQECYRVHPFDLRHGQWLKVLEMARRENAADDKIISKDGAEIVENQAGGRQSRLDARFDIIPPYALQVLAEVRHFAAEVRGYPDWNWKKIPAKDHLNHAMQHISKFIDREACEVCSTNGDSAGLGECKRHGQDTEDHAAHALCRIAMWVEMLREEGKR